MWLHLVHYCLIFAPVIHQFLQLPAAVTSPYHMTSYQGGFCSLTAPGILYQLL